MKSDGTQCGCHSYLKHNSTIQSGKYMKKQEMWNMFLSIWMEDVKGKVVWLCPLTHAQENTSERFWQPRLVYYWCMIKRCMICFWWFLLDCWIKIKWTENKQVLFLAHVKIKAGIKWIMRGKKSTVYISQHASTGGHCVHKIRTKTGVL